MPRQSVEWARRRVISLLVLDRASLEIGEWQVIYQKPRFIHNELTGTRTFSFQWSTLYWSVHVRKMSAARIKILRVKATPKSTPRAKSGVCNACMD